jgi:hypothetical protein
VANPNKITYSEPLLAPGVALAWDGKQVELAAGGDCSSLTVTNGTLRLSGELRCSQVVTVNPTGGVGAPENGLYLAGASGWLGIVLTAGTRRDHGKIGSGTHDLVIGAWHGRCSPPLETAEGAEPVHRDGLQVMSAERVRIGWIDLQNPYPGATNGGLWLNPNKSDDAIDQNDPTLIQDVVIEGGRIVFPNAAIHLGACTRCGAADTILIAQRPFRVNAEAVDPVDHGNLKYVLEA